MFGKRRPVPVAVTHDDARAHVYMVHYVEHDKVIVCNAPDIQRAITFAREHAHVIDDARVMSRPMMYDNDRICVMLYGADMQYTCNVMRMDVVEYNARVDIVLHAA